MSDHNILLNDNKTVAIIITAPNRKHQQDVSCVNVCGCNIVPSPTIRDIGITIDCGLTMTSHVSRMCTAAYYHLYAISKIRHCLTTDACKTPVHAIVISRLDLARTTVTFPIDDHYNVLAPTLKMYRTIFF